MAPTICELGVFNAEVDPCSDADADDEDEEEDGMDSSNMMFAVMSSQAPHDFSLPTPRRLQNRIRRITFASDVDGHLDVHRRPRAMDPDTKANLTVALKKNRFCSCLNSASLETMVATMEYFEFEANDTVMQQKAPGRYFYVIDRGSFEEQVNGKTVGTLTSGNSIGGIALVYNTGRASSLVAKCAGSVWGVNGTIFRQVLHEHSKSHYQENRHVLDQLSMFEGLSSKKKERVGQLALFTEIYEPGVVVKQCGNNLAAVYVVKSGKLVAHTAAGREVQTFAAGDSFGWRQLMYGELEDIDIMVSERCELVGMGLGPLEKALGGSLATCLMRSYAVSILRKTHVFALLPPRHVRKIAESMVTHLYSAGERLDDEPVLAVVVDGQARWEHQGGGTTLQRGAIYEHPELQKMQAETFGGSSSSSLRPSVNSGDLIAEFPVGCRLSLLRRDRLVAALTKLGLPLSVDDTTGLQYLKKALFVRKVPIFKELSDEQINGLVVSLVCKQHRNHTPVFEQGTVGDAFYIITSGKVQIVLDGKPIRQLGPGASFGERALLFNEPRSATVQVMDEDLELWSVDRQAFRTAITESMRENLVKTIAYTGTNVSMKDIKHLRFIGAGAFGTVRLVEHKRTGLRYALKRIRKTNGNVPEEVNREINLLSENHHPFLLHYVDCFETEKSKYILTELVTGGQLHEQVLEKMGVLPRKAAQFYIGSLALTLETIHERSIAFRDLKPENVMLDQQGYIKLVDFGLAVKLGDHDPRTYTVAGTAMYMAPEVVLGSGYGTECDIWSLGVMLFEFVTGQLPFGADAEAPSAIFEAIVSEPLEFPARYNDSAGKKLMQSVLHKEYECRTTSWTDIKDHKYFRQGVTGNLFSNITGREMPAPLIPEGETYSTELSLMDKVTGSDTEELGIDEPTDIGCRLLLTFKKFDLNGDGCIDKTELNAVLGALDPVTFNKEAVDQLFTVIDIRNRGVLAYDDFVAWVVNDESCNRVRDALRDSIKLDARQ